MTNNINTINQYNESTSPLKILVIGERNSGKTLLCNIIKDVLENNYTFRSVFNNRNVAIDEVSVDSEGQPVPPELQQEENKEEEKPTEIK